MYVKPQVLHAGGGLSSFEKIILDVSNDSIDKITKLIPVDDVDIIFYDGGPNRGIPHFGFGGFTLGKNLIVIPVNSEFQNLKLSIKENLPRTIAHELYHCLRNYNYNKERNLLGAFINDGLADHFAIEVTGKPPEKWSTALDEKQILRFLNIAKKDFHNDKYNHQSWFFGSEKENIPHWAGYSIGFYLVSKYFKIHPDKKPSNIYMEKAFEFI